MAGLVPSGDSEGESVASLLASGGCPWDLLDWGCLPPALPQSSHSLLFISQSSLWLSWKRTPVLGFGAHTNPEWPHLEILGLITSAKSLFPNKVTVTVFRWTYLLEVHHSPTTGGKSSEKVQIAESFLETPFVDISRKERQTAAHISEKWNVVIPFTFWGLSGIYLRPRRSRN